MKYIVSIKDKEEKNELSFEFKCKEALFNFIIKIMESSDYIVEIFAIKEEN